MKKKIAENTEFDVLICTYNNANGLDQLLASLHNQDSEKHIKNIIVIDNNCTDHTASVIGSWKIQLPKIRHILEPKQGLVFARKRAIHESIAKWIVFLDDDNIPRPDFLRQAGEFTNLHPKAAGFNGHTHLLFESNPKQYVQELLCFANFNPGKTICRKRMLHGAGMFLQREAVIQSGWLDNPMAADRIGKSLDSGGDMEMSMRIGNYADGLWYSPSCVLDHFISTERTQLAYLCRLNYQLLKCRSFLTALDWHSGYEEWRTSSRRQIWREAKCLGGIIYRMLRLRQQLSPLPLIQFFRLLGYIAGHRVQTSNEKHLISQVLGKVLWRTDTSK